MKMVPIALLLLFHLLMNVPGRTDYILKYLYIYFWIYSVNGCPSTS